MPDDLTLISRTAGEGKPATVRLGELGEIVAAKHLVEQGYRIVMTNFKTAIGRNSRGAEVSGEIDIVALDGATICFVEVKTRRSDDFAPVIVNVDRRKQRQIIRTARAYRRLFGVWEMEHRYDVVSVLMPKFAEPTIELARGYWGEDKFRKKAWAYEPWHDHA